MSLFEHNTWNISLFKNTCVVIIIIKIVFHFEGTIKWEIKAMQCLEEFGFILFFVLSSEMLFYYFSFQNMDKPNCNVENMTIIFSVQSKYLQHKLAHHTLERVIKAQGFQQWHNSKHSGSFSTHSDNEGFRHHLNPRFKNLLGVTLEQRRHCCLFTRCAPTLGVL